MNKLIKNYLRRWGYRKVVVGYREVWATRHDGCRCGWPRRELIEHLASYFAVLPDGTHARLDLDYDSTTPTFREEPTYK